MLNDIFSNIINFKSVYKNFPAEIIGEFISSTNKKCLVVVDDVDFINIINSEFVWDSDKILLLPPKSTSSLSSPFGFKTHYDVCLDLFNVVAASLWDNVSGLVVSKEHEFLELPKHGVSGGFVVDNSVDYSTLVNFLTDNGYAEVDIVSECGEFAKRGAVVDFYPHTTTSPVRFVCFDNVELFLFDRVTQLTKKEIKGVEIPSLLPVDKKTICNLSDLGWLELVYRNGVFGCRGVHTVSCFPYSTFVYNQYISGFNKNIKVNYLKTNCGVGLLGTDSCFVPRLFDIKGTQGEALALSVADFEVGDYLIHRDCGVGRFLGIFDRGVEENQDFLAIQYADGKIYVDIHSLHKITFFASCIEQNITLDFLNKKGLWNRRYNGVKSKMSVFVSDLYDLYNKKFSLRSSVYTHSGDLECDFINSFKYKETVDQERVWSEISSDLSSDALMDRLICGDVGFGKTELAMRASFRVVFGGGRVLVLAPTTILTKQLYDSFKARMLPFGVSIEYLSRVKTVSQKNKVEVLWVEGKIDILIGTHLLLNNDNFLKNSSLFIVDEEHRFGVAQKEKVRLVGKNVDLLSMSATPIPRTLSMALGGFKSISSLSTPPHSRKPIITQVMWFNEDVVCKSIFQEYSRGGQVFFVNNNIKTLTAYYDLIVHKMPFLKVALVHGQMKPSEVENIMLRFVDKKIDVLVTTTIIESGLDVPNANTVIINNSHNFGLSQLYQLRGRVGRSDVQAFCFLLVPHGVNLNNNARKRLKAIEKNTHLGAGYNISNMDLDIRGAGSLFGYKQSGGTSVGFELYSNMLKEAVNRLGDEKKNYFYNVSFSSQITPYIPKSYIDSDLLRLSFYRRLNSVVDVDEVCKLLGETVDRFGEPPDSVVLLFDEFKIRVLASSLFINSFYINNDVCEFGFELSFWEPFSDRLMKFVGVWVGLNNYDYKYLEKSGSYCLRLNNKGAKLTYKIIVDFLEELKKIF